MSRDARLLNIGLWNLADDEGRLQELPNAIIGEIFPTDDDVTTVVLREWLGELQVAGMIVRYSIDGEDYIQCHDFGDHQVINKPRPSELPPPPEPKATDSGTAPVELRDYSRGEEEGKRNKEWNGRGRDRPPLATDEERALTFTLIGAFASLAQQRFNPDNWIDRVVPCLRSNPDLTEADHLAIIRFNLENPWWTDSPTPAVLYSEPATFEGAVAKWRGRKPSSRKYASQGQAA
ncbi:MAG: hypothetical protein J0H98_00500 [Solirubrobacterales bacterium]|nr:hypothetical protein [Solirubrobacterales bacterium]